MENYSAKLIERRTSLVMDDVEQIQKLLEENFPKDGVYYQIIDCLINIEVALDFDSDESDDWKFYTDGSRKHLNK